MEPEQRLQITNTLITVRDYVRWGASSFNQASLFFGHGTDNAWDEAVQLVMAAVHLTGTENPHVLDARLTDSERLNVLDMLLARVEQRLPAAYITQQARFAGLWFYVDERVLVPRSPVAELIERHITPWLPIEPEYILDLCTGSGCIGIACAYEFPYAEVDLSDISDDAIAVANINISKHQMEQQVTAVQSDLFANLEGRCYDLIISNPPYVDAEDLAAMPTEYQAEPAIGLGSGVDGLDFTRRLLQAAAQHLNDQGVLLVEVGNSGEALEEAFPELTFTWVELERGGHGVFVLTREELVAAGFDATK